MALPVDSDRPKIARGEDGRVYADGRSGKHTLVVDGDGAVAVVGIGKQDLPSPNPPATKPADSPSRLGRPNRR